MARTRRAPLHRLSGADGRHDFSALVHPWFYLLLAFDLWQGRLLAIPDTVFGQWLLGIGIFNLIAGYLSAIALGTVAAARRGRCGWRLTR